MLISTVKNHIQIKNPFPLWSLAYSSKELGAKTSSSLSYLTNLL